jgi:hypothetical protein
VCEGDRLLTGVEETLTVEEPPVPDTLTLCTPDLDCTSPVLLTVTVPHTLGEKLPPPVPVTTTLFDTVLVIQEEGLGIQEADTVTLATAVGLTVPLNPTHLPMDAIHMPLHMGGAKRLVQEDPRWGSGSPGDPPHTPSVSAGCKKEGTDPDPPPPPHLLTQVLFRENEVVKADKREHEAAVATGLHLTLPASHTSPALHRG